MSFTIVSDRFSPEPDVVTYPEFVAMCEGNGWPVPALHEDVAGNLCDDLGAVLAVIA